MEEKDWQNVLKQAVCKELKDRFSLAVYAEPAPQKIQMPCFTAEVTECSQKRLLGRRREMRVTLEIGYHTENRLSGREEALQIAEELYDCLWLVGSSEKFCAETMGHETKEGQMVFRVCYCWHVVQQEKETLMQRLEYNGRKVVGYGQDSEI